MYFLFENHSTDDNMGRKRLHGQLIGIRLLPESYLPQCQNSEQLSKGKIIGTIFIPIEGTTCSQLRQSISKSLDVPKDFCFLNSAGWPFDILLEDKIPIVDCLISNVVTIQLKHPKFTRVGIKVLNGPMLGFINLNFGYEISHIRNQIMSDLGDQFEDNETFEFLDNNLWPVQKKQENELSVWELVMNNCITLIKKHRKRSLEDEVTKTDKKLKNSIDLIPEENNYNFRSILISYVHDEGMSYARALKRALKNIGFNDVFLDIDDIPAGDDWQDVISSAVNRCSIFIPLVTHRYGETRWTNREAKLADDRQKTIIPISFVDKWPPDQLAIQFLTLQYIPWKTTDDYDTGNFSGQSDTTWAQKSILRVVNEIKKLCSDTEISTPDSVSLLDDKPSSSINFTLNLSGRQRRKNHGDAEKIFIVISAHSKQQRFVEDNITKMLESQGFHVWNSMCLCDCDENTFSPIEDTHPLHSPTFENSSIVSNFGHTFNSVKDLKCTFKEKVKAAKLVVLVFSEDYVNSSICRQQAFYCEHRKKNIVIKYENFQIDGPLLNLYPEHEMITKENLECLKYKIRDKLHFDYETSYWNSVNLMVTKLKSVVNTNLAVYVIGATEKINKVVEEFCRNLGNELAKVNNLNLVTGSSKGVADIVGRNFCEEQEIMNKGQAPKIFHIIPKMDSSDYDGSLEMLPYGKTLYYGESVSNRDDIVASAFKLCILIAGGEQSACLAEKFLYYECTVIPVLFNNTAIKKRHCLKNSITKVPNGVQERDWHNLNKNITPEEKAKTVKRIICSILNV